MELDYCDGKEEEVKEILAKLENNEIMFDSAVNEILEMFEEIKEEATEKTREWCKNNPLEVGITPR